MSVTTCRSCDTAITFVLREDGRWRPVEVTYQELEPEGSEMLAVQRGGSWTQVKGAVRVYTAHRCPEDPSWNRGRPTMTTRVLVDAATGEIVEPEPEPEPSLPERVDDWHSARRERRERITLLRATPQRSPVVDCEGCGAAYGEPCVNEYGSPVVAACLVRKLTIAFDEDFGEPWPPRHNQAGYVQMKDWLRENHTLFAIEESP